MPTQERIPEPSNPLGIDGIEFVEYSTAKPQALGQVEHVVAVVVLAAGVVGQHVVAIA